MESNRNIVFALVFFVMMFSLSGINAAPTKRPKTGETPMKPVNHTTAMTSMESGSDGEKHMKTSSESYGPKIQEEEIGGNRAARQIATTVLEPKPDKVAACNLHIEDSLIQIRNKLDKLEERSFSTYVIDCVTLGFVLLIWVCGCCGSGVVYKNVVFN